MAEKTVINSNKSTLLETSILVAGAGAMVLAVSTQVFFSPMLGLSMIGTGVIGVVSHFILWSKFDRLWKNLNICKGTCYPQEKNKEETDYSFIYTFTIPAGISLDDFERNKIAIEQFLGTNVDIKYTHKEIQIEVFKTNEQKIYEYKVTECKGNVSILVGYLRSGKEIYCDLSSGEPHMLIAGETGSGKSTVLRSIITNLILTKDIKLHLIDLKRGAEFQIFSKCSKVKTFARTRSEAETALTQISLEIDRRYDLFFDNNCVDIKEYNRKVGKMGYEVVIVDEFADLQNEKGSISIIEEIGAKARACGIHMIIATQRPDYRVLNGRIKANCATVLGLKTMNEANSRIIIDDIGLEKLKGKGHGIFKRGYSLELQCPYLSTERAKELLQHTYVEKKKKVELEFSKDGEVPSFDFLDVIVQ